MQLGTILQPNHITLKLHVNHLRQANHVLLKNKRLSARS